MKYDLHIIQECLHAYANRIHTHLRLCVQRLRRQSGRALGIAQRSMQDTAKQLAAWLSKFESTWTSRQLRKHKKERLQRHESVRSHRVVGLFWLIEDLTVKHHASRMFTWEQTPSKFYEISAGLRISIRVTFPQAENLLTTIASCCIVWHCIAFHLSALLCMQSIAEPRWFALHCIALHCIELHCTELRCIVLLCITLHPIVLIALNCIASHHVIFDG